MHSHQIPHWLTCIKGAFRALDGNIATIFKENDPPYLVRAHHRHGLWALEHGTIGQCVFEDSRITPERFGVKSFEELQGIPLEILHSLTDEVENESS
jgi:hypothetical protein